MSGSQTPSPNASIPALADRSLVRDGEQQQVEDEDETQTHLEPEQSMSMQAFSPRLHGMTGALRSTTANRGS